jgi:hypothetical protein
MKPRRATHALPIVVIDTSTLRKLEAKYTHFSERVQLAPQESLPFLQSRYGFLDWLTKDMGLTVVVPRAVVREMLHRRDGHCHDLYWAKSEKSAIPKLKLHIRPNHLMKKSINFAYYLNEKNSLSMPDWQPALRLYDSSFTMLKKEASRSPGGFAIVSSPVEGPITEQGLRLASERGGQEGDNAIFSFCMDTVQRMSGARPTFPILTEDKGLRIKINERDQPGAVYATDLRAFLKSLPPSSQRQENVRAGFLKAFDYEREPEKEAQPFFIRMVANGRQWHDIMKRQGKQFPSPSRAKEENTKEVSESLLQKPAFMPRPVVHQAQVITESPPSHTTEEKQKKTSEPRNPSKFGPDSRVPFASPPLTFKTRTGSLTEAEQERRERALKEQRNAHRR